MHLHLYSCEDPWLTWVNEGWGEHIPSPAKSAVRPHERVHTDPCEFVNIQITKALERHRQCHLFEVTGYVSTDHCCGKGLGGVT